MLDRYARQSDLITPANFRLPIHIIGVGGIGSWTALVLAKMGAPDITIYDFDKVENHNVASQFFSPSDLEDKKTEALARNIERQTDIRIKIKEPKDEKNINEGIIIVAVDKMEERWKLYNLWKNTPLPLIDSRMGGLQLEIYVTNTQHWNETLVRPDEVQAVACTARSICFNCFVIAGLIANEVRKLQTGTIPFHKIIFGFENNEFLKANL